MRRNRQFTLGGLVAIITALCAYMALPGGADILVSVCYWLLIASLVVGGLMILQLPLFLLLRRRLSDKDIPHTDVRHLPRNEIPASQGK